MPIRLKVLIYLSCVVLLCASEETSDELIDYGEPLYLTPYLEEGRFEEALQKAKVEIQNNTNVNSYAGFINVNQTFKSEMFFWYFPSETTPQDAPLILWLQGGPGMTGLYGVFYENGPFVYVNDEIQQRRFSWNKEYNVLYVDSPVGTGYSHTLEGGYSTDALQTAINLHTFLLQFFKLFPDVKNNDLYLVGESYAGKYIPALGNVIHERNQPNVLINLKGMAIGNGFIDPINQISYGKYLHAYGLIDNDGVEQFDLWEKQFKEHVKNERWTKAAESLITLINHGSGMCTDSLFCNLTNFNQSHLITRADRLPGTEFKVDVHLPELRRSIHVGGLAFAFGSEVAYFFLEDFVRSVADYLVECLDNYKVILYSGQLDIIVSYPSVRNMLKNLNFSSSDDWKTSKREVWKVDGEVAGLSKTAGNLTEILVYGAGHKVNIQQPQRAYQIIKQLTAN